MSNQTFVFKQFKIVQDKCAMKVGTDAVLLGSWVNASNAKTILDIGTGTGIISLMLAQKSGARIDAIDIDTNAFIQASENVNDCAWKDRIDVHHISLQQFTKESDHKYDLIVSNPPYFVDSSKAMDIAPTEKSASIGCSNGASSRTLRSITVAISSLTICRNKISSL